MRVKRVDHVGIIVANLERAVAQFERALGVRLDRVEDFGPGQLRIAFLGVDDTWLELIEPVAEDGTAARWLRANGQGLQHVALEVDDLEAAISHLERAGLTCATPVLAGASGSRIVFLREADLAGAMVELVELAGSRDGAA